jgi:hypothetical protein
MFLYTLQHLLKRHQFWKKNILLPMYNLTEIAIILF